jgi:AAA domain/Primase C terminal 2 (PriCT-2)/Bifunctional DNA primase/polymerase, N-terminal
MNFLKQHGKALLDLGYPIIPIKRGFKYPKGLPNWQETDAGLNQLDTWLANGFADGGVGVLTEHFPAVDIDVLDARLVDQLADWCAINIGDAPRRIGLAPKTLLCYRTDEPFYKIQSKTYEDHLGQRHKVEILGVGQQYVAYAEHPDTQEPYTWDRDLNNLDPVELVEITAQQAHELIRYFESIVPDDWTIVARETSSKPVDTSLTPPERGLRNAKPKVDISDKHIDQCLTEIEDFADDYDQWVKVGMALYHQFDGSTEGLSLWDSWSANSSKYVEKEITTKWNSFKANLSRQEPVTFASVIRLAKDHRRERDHAQRIERMADAGSMFVKASELMANTASIKWTIKGYLEQDAVGVLFGAPGSYKSFLAIDMALCIATGHLWHGRTVEQGPVVYIAGEGHGGLGRRIKAWSKHTGVEITDDTPIYFSRRGVHINDKDSIKTVVEELNTVTEIEGAPALIVLDTLARNFGGGDENSTADMSGFVDNLHHYLREPYGSTVLVLHHTGHANKQRARGSVALQAGIDFEYRTDKAPGDRVALSCTRMKDGEEPRQTWFEAQNTLIGNFEGEDATSLAFIETEAPVTEETPLKGKQKSLFETIEKEAPVERETLRQIVLLEGLFENSRQFKDCLWVLKDKQKIDENDKYISVIDEFS